MNVTCRRCRAVKMHAARGLCTPCAARWRCPCSHVVTVGGVAWAYDRALGWHDPAEDHATRRAA